MPTIDFCRGNHVESRHDVAYAEVAPDGFVLGGSASDLLVCLRSMAKPFQAIAALDDGTASAFSLTDAHIAAACGIHHAEPVHQGLVEDMLVRAGIAADRLRCGSLVIAGAPSATGHYCAANHALVLLHCLHRGWDLDGYEQADHPAQRAAADIVARMGGIGIHDIGRAVDSCAMPALFLPLAAVARAYGRLAAQSGSAARVSQAMRAHPELVGGDGVIDTEAMRHLPGAVSKMGAESLLALGFADGRAVALKVRDGAERAAAPALLALLDRMGVPLPEALHSHRAPSLRRSHDGAPIGEVMVRMDRAA